MAYCINCNNYLEQCDPTDDSEFDPLFPPCEIDNDDPQYDPILDVEDYVFAVVEFVKLKAIQFKKELEGVSENAESAE